MADDEPTLEEMEIPMEAPAESKVDDFVPPSIEEDVWNSSFFRTACTLEMVSLAELAEVDKLEKQVTKLRKLLSEKRLNDQEHADRIKQLMDCEVDQVDPIMVGLKFARDLLLKAVMGTMKELERQADTQLPFPVPSSLEIEEFTSEDFKKACDIHGVTLATVAETERVVQEVERLERLLNNERITQDEYHRNVLSLTGHPPTALPRFIKDRRKAEATLISKIRKIVKDRQKHEQMEAEAKQHSMRKKEAFLSKFKSQIDEVIAKEQAKADLTLMRKRSKLEKLLIQRGIEDQLALVKDADAHINPDPALRHGYSSTKTYEYVSKGTAALERKKLFLDEKMKKSRLNRVTSQDSEVGGVPGRVLAARERKEALMQERRKLIDAHHQEKMVAAHQRMERQMEKREKIFADAHRKKEKRDQTVARMEWANAKRKDMLQSKINEDEDRLAALKELKSKQQLAVAEIQAQSIQKERDLLTVLYRAENEAGFNIHEAIEQLGLELNLQQVEENVKAYTERLCSQTKSITTPVLTYAPPDSVAKRRTGLRYRPFSAPPGGPSSPDLHNSAHESYRKSMGISRARPATAATTRGGGRLRPFSGVRKELSESTAEQDEAVGTLLKGKHGMERLERLRVEQAKNLYHVVLEEQAYERERQGMRQAIQPGQRPHLDRLFERERQAASERIMRAAGENEMVMLQEMALIAAEEEEEDEMLEEEEEEETLMDSAGSHSDMGRISEASRSRLDSELEPDNSELTNAASQSQLELESGPPSPSPVLPGPAAASHTFDTSRADSESEGKVNSDAEDSEPESLVRGASDTLGAGNLNDSAPESSRSALGFGFGAEGTESGSLLDVTGSASSDRFPSAPPGAR